jgi:hypothetical protein
MAESNSSEGVNNTQSQQVPDGKVIADQSLENLHQSFNPDASQPPIQFPDWIIELDRDGQGRVRAKAMLSRFRTDDSEILSIRHAESYSTNDDDLIELGKSLIRDGKSNILSDVRVVYNPGADHLTVIAGNRRVTAAIQNVMSKKVPDSWQHCVIVPMKDRLEEASMDNAGRKDLDDIELFNQIVLLERQNKSVGSIAGTIIKSEDTVRRYLSISRYPVLVAMLKDGMPYSKLASIADKLKEASPTAVQETMAFLKKWHLETVPTLRQKKKDEAAKGQKTVSKKSLELGRMLRRGEFEGWLRDIKGGNAPTGTAKKIKCVASLDGNKFKLSGVSFNLEDQTLDEVTMLVIEMQTDVLGVLEKARRMKETQESSDREVYIDEAKAKLMKKYGISNPYEGDEEKGDDEPVPSNDDEEGEDNTTGFDEDAG